ncbi:MAG TPA: hypothetical protein PK078_06595 [Anaerolineales bacterium]|nr:hypothetical protein [Anaerolineales bacterium]HNA89032.1 hypothetical protein [Anaerolineales bacterium]HNC07950.1 hypothetical protein [Anaerolineales bacterium]
MKRLSGIALFEAGLGDVVDRMIWSGEILPFIIVATDRQKVGERRLF